MKVQWQVTSNTYMAALKHPPNVRLAIASESSARVRRRTLSFAATGMPKARIGSRVCFAWAVIR
jgi:hypothetical protein